VRSSLARPYDEAHRLDDSCMSSKPLIPNDAPISAEAAAEIRAQYQF
jgi:hypothetical protein